MNYIHKQNRKCWLGYFDLLGTKQLVKSGRTREVIYSFADALKSLDTLDRSNSSIFHAWFSDTFIVYSHDDSQEVFAAFEKMCRWFMTALIWRNIPVRGSISCGRLYSDEANRIYVGPALINAYEWGERQDWIGLLLCPSCITSLEQMNQSVKSYRYYVEFTNPPFMKTLPGGESRCAACVLGNWIREGDTNLNGLLRNLRKMRDGQQDETVIRKYTRAIDFIEQYQEV